MPLDTLIVDAEKVPLSNDDIIAIALGQTSVVRYSDLPQHESIFDLLQPYNNFILFYEVKERNDGHWVSVLYHEDINTLEFFDSYGFDDRQILGKSPTSHLYMQGKPYLTYLFDKAQREQNCRIIFNTKQLQSKRSQIATCGRYAAFRSRMRHVKYNQFIALFKGNKNTSDYLISALTVLFSPTANALV